MASLPIRFHISGLVDTLKLGPGINDIQETMVELYLKGEVAFIWPFLRAISPETGDSAGGYAAFEEKMIYVRNATMVEHALPILEKGGAFIAVGAMHLPGEKGLIERLRAEGYTVTRVAL